MGKPGTCETCRWWVQYGQCRKREFAQNDHSEWCGGWEPARRDKNEQKSAFANIVDIFGKVHENLPESSETIRRNTNEGANG